MKFGVVPTLEQQEIEDFNFNFLIIINNETTVLVCSHHRNIPLESLFLLFSVFESPLERLEKGKKSQAALTITAELQEQYICISISDDGKGINVDTIHQKAVERQIISSDDILSRRQVLELIFQPGFSTKETQNKLSGRGVGLDVVYSTISDLQGTIEIITELVAENMVEVGFGINISDSTLRDVNLSIRLFITEERRFFAGIAH